MTAALTSEWRDWPLPAKLKLLDRLNQRLKARYVPQHPTPKQSEFLALTCREALYGGSAGGGKSSALLMDALRSIDQPGYAALLLRRTYKDLSLPGALMDRAAEWLGGSDAHWTGDTKTWTFPSGATLTFGYMEHDNDRYQYQGAEFQYIGFDEATQFTEAQYRYLFSRLRRANTVNVPLKMRSASNPGGIGHEWVKQRFLVEGPAHRRVFIPARLSDNPYLNQVEYAASLSELDEVTRMRYLHGDWDVIDTGTTFDRAWFTDIVDSAPVDCRQVRYWDMAATKPKPGRDPDYTVGAKVGRTRQGMYYIIDLVRLRDRPAVTESIITQTAQMDGTGVEIFMEQEPGSSGVTVIDSFTRGSLSGFAFQGDRVTGSKTIRSKPFSTQARAGNVKLVRGPWINAFLDEIMLFPNGAHDDQVDAVSGAFQQLSGFAESAGATIDLPRATYTTTERKSRWR